jgi:hypothetical protein
MQGQKYFGVERSTFLIDRGRTANIWCKVKAPGPAEAVLPTAKALWRLGKGSGERAGRRAAACRKVGLRNTKPAAGYRIE